VRYPYPFTTLQDRRSTLLNHLADGHISTTANASQRFTRILRQRIPSRRFIYSRILTRVLRVLLFSFSILNAAAAKPLGVMVATYSAINFFWTYGADSVNIHSATTFSLRHLSVTALLRFLPACYRVPSACLANAAHCLYYAAVGAGLRQVSAA